MPPAEVQKAVEKEFEMALQDRIMEETKDRKNALEAYVYDMRNKVINCLVLTICYSMRIMYLGSSNLFFSAS